MPSEEYLKAKEERAKKDKKTSIIVFSLVMIALIGGIVFTVITVAN